MTPLFINIAYVAGHGNVWTVRNSVPVTVRKGRSRFFAI